MTKSLTTGMPQGLKLMITGGIMSEEEATRILMLFEALPQNMCLILINSTLTGLTLAYLCFPLGSRVTWSLGTYLGEGPAHISSWIKNQNDSMSCTNLLTVESIPRSMTF